MTPDELPADMEAVVARIDHAVNGVSRPVSLQVCGSQTWALSFDDLRALLLAYQERGRVLAFYADPISYALTQVSEPRSAVHGDDGKRARAALNQKGDER